MEVSKQFEEPIEAKLRRRINGGFIVAVVLTIFIDISSRRSAGLAADDAAWVAHTYSVMDALEVTAKHVFEVETSADFCHDWRQPVAYPLRDRTGRRCAGRRHPAPDDA
jgi:hypothetical protein